MLPEFRGLMQKHFQGPLNARSLQMCSNLSVQQKTLYEPKNQEIRRYQVDGNNNALKETGKWDRKAKRARI